MKFIAFLIVILAILAGVIGPQAFFVVDENQVAIVTRFGEIRTAINDPGLNVKTPFVENVTYYEKRLLLFDAPPEPLLTKDKKRLIIDVYARGRISDPGLFRETVRTETLAIPRVVDIIASELRREIALDDQSEIIRTNREEIMNRVRDAVAPEVKRFGIEIVDVRVKRADFPMEIADSIFARMQAERKRKADKERAEGAKKDAEVRADVDKQAAIILATAERDASITRGCGEAEAIKIFAQALERDPEFYTFQRSLEAYSSILSQNTTVVMPVGGFGELFEDIRKGVNEATEVPDSSTGTNGHESQLVTLGSRCAEVGALRTVSSKETIDLLDLELMSVEEDQWTDASLGCPEEGRTYSPGSFDGFNLEVKFQDTTYEVHSNEHGSLVVICNIQTGE